MHVVERNSSAAGREDAEKHPAMWDGGLDTYVPLSERWGYSQRKRGEIVKGKLCNGTDASRGAELWLTEANGGGHPAERPINAVVAVGYCMCNAKALTGAALAADLSFHQYSPNARTHRSAYTSSINGKAVSRPASDLSTLILPSRSGC